MFLRTMYGLGQPGLALSCQGWPQTSCKYFVFTIKILKNNACVYVYTREYASFLKFRVYAHGVSTPED